MEIPGDSGAKIDLPRKKCAGTGREGARLREVAGEREKQAFLAAERQGVAHQASRVHPLANSHLVVAEDVEQP